LWRRRSKAHRQRPKRSEQLDHHLLDVPPARTCQRQTRTAIVLCVKTSFAWLPRIKRLRPRRPCTAAVSRGIDDPTEPRKSGGIVNGVTTCRCLR
jgi:hypothetical protein